MKRSIYKIMGVTGIIALLLLGSIVVAGPAARRPSIEVSQELEVQAQPQQQPQQQYQDFLIADYDDDAYAVPGYPDETAPYRPTAWTKADLCTTIIARFRAVGSQGRIYVRIRNLGMAQSTGGQAIIRVHAFLSGEWMPILKETKTVAALLPYQATTEITSKVPLNQFVHLVTVHIPWKLIEEGARGLNFRVGFVAGLII